MRILHRTSFTTRLLAIAGAVLLALVVIDYVALLKLPARVARDTVEIALRENVQSLNATFREDRTQLLKDVDAFTQRRDASLAILEKDPAALDPLVSEYLGADVKYKFIKQSAIEKSGVGAVTAAASIVATDRSQDIVFYRPTTNNLLDRAAKTAGGQVAFALERNDRYVARGVGFPHSLAAKDVDTSLNPDVAEVDPIHIDGEDLHLYSRRLTSDTSYELHALSTPQLENSALADVRGDVRTAITGMTLATIAAFLLLAFFVNRSVGGFARRVRALADGDYGSRLPVRGRDAFSDLAGSVNRLSVQLEDQLGQLRDSANAFSRTLETLEEGICVWTEGGEVTYWNRGAEQLTGLARERVETGDRVVDFLRAERAPGTRRVTLPVRRSGSGLVVDLLVTAMPGGGVVQTFRDTTLVDMLQQTQRNFMATAAHELRTPITAILGFADTLANPELELTERQREEFVSIIREQSHHLQRIAEAFFTNHQLANERVEVSIAPTSVAGVVEDVVERLGRALPDRAEEVAAVRVDVADDCIALADRRGLVGVVSVLVENAVKYGAAPISVTAERTGGSIALLVRDEGQGIDPYHQGRVFDPFYRIDVDMRSGVGGAGLGLFTARKLVESMQGIIRVRSAPGAGATFIVELPAAPVGSGAGEGATGLRLVG
ncbi:MAG: hypothetical protein JWM98_207 [Thermoleophilia bacterium]|nr:hypothetical protein [Thermoleophilia bacterium]